MKIQYFQDTDTLYIEFKASKVAETRDLDENTLLDLDDKGNIRGITVEHADEIARISHASHTSRSQSKEATVKLMLHWLNETEHATRLESAIARVIAEGKVRTYDMGGDASTLDVAKAITDYAS